VYSYRTPGFSFVLIAKGLAQNALLLTNKTVGHKPRMQLIFASGCKISKKKKELSLPNYARHIPQRSDLNSDHSQNFKSGGSKNISSLLKNTVAKR
jgi:hypothetical protein